MDNFLRDDELGNDLFDRVFVPRASFVTGDINIHRGAPPARTGTGGSGDGDMVRGNLGPDGRESSQ